MFFPFLCNFLEDEGDCGNSISFEINYNLYEYSIYKYLI